MLARNDMAYDMVVVLYHIALPNATPIRLKPGPSSHVGLRQQLEVVHDEIIGAVGGHLTLTHVATHGDVQQDDKIRHGPRPSRDGRLHDGAPVDPPDHAAGARARLRLVLVLVLVLVLHPSEFEPHGPTGLHALDRGADDAVLVLVLRRVEAPVQARVVDAVAVPGLADVDLAVRRPRERFKGQQPERRPDPGCAGQCQCRDQAALRPGQALSRHEPRRGVFAAGVRVVRLGPGAQDEEVVWCARGISR